MKLLLHDSLILVIYLINVSVIAQPRTGGPCEGCEAIYESSVPFHELEATVTLPGTTWQKRKPLEINGVIYKADGITPAEGVIVYVYHTDQRGYYAARDGAMGWERRHGSIRGWMRTNHKGEYKFITLRPAPYPDRTEPAHIHVVVKEPGVKEYYLDDFVFDDDPLVTEKYRGRQSNRGGSGILRLSDVGTMFRAQRDIYLGKNIPHYTIRH